MATGLAVWIGSAKGLYGGVSVATTGQILPCVYGTVASAFSPIPYTVIISLIKPQNYDWADFRKEKLAFEPPEGDGSAISAVIKEELNEATGPGSQPHLRKWFRISVYWSLATFFGHWVLWPLPMYAAKYVFSQTFFKAWLVVAIIWVWGTLLVAGFFPLINGRKQFVSIYKALRYGRKDETGSPNTKQSSTENVTPAEKEEVIAKD